MAIKWDTVMFMLVVLLKRKEYHKKYYINNRERVLERVKQYNIDNKESTAEYQKQYYINNREKRAEYIKQYNIDNKEAITKRQKQYRIENKESITKYKKQYNIDNKKSTAEYQKQKHPITAYGITRNRIYEMIIEQDHKCERCGKPFEGSYGERTSLAPVVDHNHAFKKGDPAGVRAILHRLCNTTLGFHENEKELEISNKFFAKYGKNNE